MSKKTSFTTFNRVWGFIIILMLGGSMVGLDVFDSYQDFNFRALQIRDDFIALHKQIAKNQVKNAANLVRHEIAKATKRAKTGVKERVQEAWVIAHHIYQENRAAKGRAEIQKMIVEALRPIRFKSENGYYFIVSSDGTEVLFADKPELEGRNLRGMEDTKVRYVVKDVIEIAKESGEGFYEYRWTKPDAEGNDFKKISFVKRFEPYDWVIGTGVYVVDVEKMIKADILSIISGIRFGKEGHVFVNRLNGDALVSNGKIFSGGKKLWEIFNKNPEKMKAIFKKEYNAALKPDGDFIEHSHLKLTDPTKEAPTISFVYRVPELQWLIGAGVYLDDLDRVVAGMKNRLKEQIAAKLVRFILVAVGLVALFLILFSRLDRRLTKDFKVFISFFSKSARYDEEINREKIKFVELDLMAESANRMLVDRKRAEETLKKSEKKYRTILESIEDGYYEVDIKGNLTFFNSSVCNILGYPKGELMGMNNRQYMDSENARYVFNIFNSVYNTKKPHKEVEWELIKKDGSKSYVTASVSLKIDSNGRATGFQGIIRDITEHKKTLAQLQQAQKMESVGRLAGGVAHDYNNMLSVILGFTELAIEEVDLKSPLHDKLVEILKAAKRAEDITRQLLAFARKQTIQPRVLDLNSSVERMLKMLRRLVGEDINLAWSPHAGLWPIRIDASQLDQILANLCVNARDAITDVGRLTIETENITLDEVYCEDRKGFTPGDFVLLTVSDDGCGMDGTTRNNIFEPFFTTKGEGKGTGLGLATVYGIIKQNNGFINVYSEPGNGSTFKIFLPRHEGETADIQNEDTTEISKGKGETVLVVDDDASVLKLAQRNLEGLGYTVLTAGTPNEVIGLAEKHPGNINLLITDVVMPEMNGRELAERLESLYPSLKHVFMSGYTADIIAHRGVIGEGERFIQKPFSKKGLASTVRTILDEA